MLGLGVLANSTVPVVVVLSITLILRADGRVVPLDIILRALLMPEKRIHGHCCRALRGKNVKKNGFTVIISGGQNASVNRKRFAERRVGKAVANTSHAPVFATKARLVTGPGTRSIP